MRSQFRIANRAYCSSQKGNFIINFLFNFFVPIVFLTKYSKLCGYFKFNGRLLPFNIGISPDQMAANGLFVSLLFPTVYFFYDLLFRHRKNVISIFGFVSIVVTGIVGFLQLSSEWIAIKDALIPLVVGILILLSLKMKPPLLKRLICNDEIMDISAVRNALISNGNRKKFELLFTKTTVLFFWSFVLSAVLHYVLAELVLVDDMPSNEQLGELMYLKYPYCVLPFVIFIVYIVLYMFRGMKNITGLSLDEIFPEKSLKNDKK